MLGFLQSTRYRMNDTAKNTIEDFGAQWTRYRENRDYYGSVALLQDVLGPLLAIEAIAGCRVADIGSGSGRIVLMLIRVGAAEVTAVEPSMAIEVLRENTHEFRSRISYVQARGEGIPQDRNLDYVFSIGVLHHIPNPEPVVRAAFGALRPGGQMLIWLYGMEGNEAYLWWALPLRHIVRRWPDSLVAILCHGLNLLFTPYVWLCRFVPLPMRNYMRAHFAKLSRHARFLTLFDQFNPTEARYYREDETRNLLEKAGFRDVRLYHRHGYSWTAIGTKPIAPASRDSPGS